ncbi:periplasmic heavy metal sensor [Terasakiella sp. SH-1]|uniref:periplasmic heavy metal sensor n=1 Tax=Terasakiella sp. SH-1 TaxID=2560057 RepID=UPI0010748B20|nr:periplasmic heavy metal sensor [Terasakiella sp. SH-1]
MITRNWKNILAWGSVILNVVLIAIIIVGPHHLKPRPPGPPSPQKLFRHMGQDLTGQDRVIFEQLVEKHSRLFETHHEDMRRGLDGIIRSVKAEPFDLEQVKAAHQIHSGERLKIDHAIANFVIELVSKISPQGRHQLRLKPPHKPR